MVVDVGSATISLVLAANPGTVRSAIVSIAGIAVSVTQPGLVPSINPAGIVNAASFASGSPLAPGSIATLYGSFLNIPLAMARSTPLPNNLAGLSIQFASGQRRPYSLSRVGR